jgi:hypothetical protein
MPRTHDGFFAVAVIAAWLAVFGIVAVRVGVPVLPW